MDVYSGNRWRRMWFRFKLPPNSVAPQIFLQIKLSKGFNVFFFTINTKSYIISRNNTNMQQHLEDFIRNSKLYKFLFYIYLIIISDIYNYYMGNVVNLWYLIFKTNVYFYGIIYKKTKRISVLRSKSLVTYNNVFLKVCIHYL